MGKYINPQFCTKEEWLEENGVEISKEDAKIFDDTSYAVCLVNNGPFTAAGVIFDQWEYDAFTVPGDQRPRRWYRVSRKAVESL